MIIYQPMMWMTTYYTHTYIYIYSNYIYIQIFIYGHGLSTRGWHQFPSCGFPRFLRAASHYVGGVDLDIGIFKYLRRLGWTCHWDCFWTARVISWKKNHCFPAAKVTRFAERFRVSSLPQSLGGYAWKILPSFFHLVMQQKSGFLSQSGGVTTPHSLPLGRKSHVFFFLCHKWSASPINGKPVPHFWSAMEAATCTSRPLVDESSPVRSPGMVSAIGLLQIETKKDKAKSHLKSQKKVTCHEKTKGMNLSFWWWTDDWYVFHWGHCGSHRGHCGSHGSQS